MNTNTLLISAGLCAGLGAAATGQPQHGQPQSIGGGRAVEPLRVARVAMDGGGMVFLSDWLDYRPDPGRYHLGQIFDCFGDANGDGEPDGGVLCGLGSDDERWYMGSGFCNMFYTNDMTVHECTSVLDGADRFDFAWFWTAQGSGSSEPCIVAVFTQNSEPCDSDSFDYSGWLLDYGTLSSSVGDGYYLSNASPAVGAWRLPLDRSGSYAVFFLREVTTSGAFVLATCAQPMLWATADNHLQYDGAGTQGPLELDDTDPFDGSHTSSECYSYSFSGICPSVLGGMGQFWGYMLTDCDAGFCLQWPIPNCDSNEVLDTRDFACFLGHWARAHQSGGYDSRADCDGNGSINTQDFLCFLNIFATCYE